MPTDICLGNGRWVVGHTVIDGMPSIIFTPAPKPGDPGANADGAISTTELHDHAIVLRFATGAAAVQHLDRLRLMAEFWDEWRKGEISETQ